MNSVYKVKWRANLQRCRLNDVKIEQSGAKNIGELKAGVEGKFPLM
jgi:hypothetical protein